MSGQAGNASRLAVAELPLLPIHVGFGRSTTFKCQCCLMLGLVDIYAKLRKEGRSQVDLSFHRFFYVCAFVDIFNPLSHSASAWMHFSTNGSSGNWNFHAGSGNTQDIDNAKTPFRASAVFSTIQKCPINERLNGSHTHQFPNINIPFSEGIESCSWTERTLIVV